MDVTTAAFVLVLTSLLLSPSTAATVADAAAAAFTTFTASGGQLTAVTRSGSNKDVETGWLPNSNKRQQQRQRDVIADHLFYYQEKSRLGYYGYGRMASHNNPAPYPAAAVVARQRRHQRRRTAVATGDSNNSGVLLTNSAESSGHGPADSTQGLINRADGSTRKLQFPPPATMTTASPVTSHHSAPFVQNFLRLIVIRIGDVLNFTIPEETFVDWDDGGTRQLNVTLLQENASPLPALSWVKFDSRRQIIYALPKHEHEGRHAFLLRASDADGNTVEERVRMRVMPRRKDQRDQRVPYEWTLILAGDFFQFTRDVENVAWFAQRLAHVTGDVTATATSFTRIQEGSIVVSWVNNTLPTYPCPSQDIRSVLDLMISPLDGQVGDCLADDTLAAALTIDIGSTSSSYDNSPVTNDTTTGIGHTDIVSNNVRDVRPTVNQPIGTISVGVGEVVDYVIPEVTFSDARDGNTRRLRLFFLSGDNMTVSRDSWIRLEAAQQRLYGLPLTVAPGTYPYSLAAADSQGHIAYHRFYIAVHELGQGQVKVDNEVNHEFSIVLKVDYDRFMADVSKQVDVAKRLAHLYGDVSTRHVTVRAITHTIPAAASTISSSTKSSVTFTWSNSSLATSRSTCPSYAIAGLWSLLVSTSDDSQQKQQQLLTNVVANSHTLSASLLAVFHPAYDIERVELNLMGPCTVVKPTPILQQQFSTPRPTTSIVGVEGDDDVIVVQSVQAQVDRAVDKKVVTASLLALTVLVAIVVLSAVVTLVCIRHHRSHHECLSDRKQNPLLSPVATSSSSSPAIKVRHGVPIIFANELAIANLQFQGQGHGQGRSWNQSQGQGSQGSSRGNSLPRVLVSGTVTPATAPDTPAPPKYSTRSGSRPVSEMMTPSIDHRIMRQSIATSSSTDGVAW